MKLRNSFVSLKEISNEFNIEIVAPGTATAKGNESGSSSSNQGHQSEDSSGAQSSSLTGGGGGGAGTGAGKLGKATARMRNIKKSMLNDNKLGKLRQKFIKRSKSVIELSNINNEFSQELKSEQAITQMTNDNFKENLNPDQFAALSSPPPAQHNTSNTNSMNRNKVRMGTRVFSQQFLNRSYDNICDNAFNMARMQEGDQSVCSSVGTGLDAGGGICHESFDPIDELDSEEEQQAVVVCNPDEGPKLAITEQHGVAAYVLHESINSSSNYTQRMEQYSVGAAEETVSDSLLEKFNNLSSTGVEDRVIRTLEIQKDAVAPKGDAPDVDKAAVVQKTSAFERFKVLSSSRFSKRFLQSKKSKALEERDLEQQNYSLGISIVQGSDGNIYVKELAPGCAGYRHGIRMGDQVISEETLVLFDRCLIIVTLSCLCYWTDSGCGQQISGKGALRGGIATVAVEGTRGSVDHLTDCHTRAKDLKGTAAEEGRALQVGGEFPLVGIVLDSEPHRRTGRAQSW